MTRRPPTVRSAREGFDTSNLLAATLIASNPVAYPPGSLMHQWAAIIIERQQPTVRGPLFQATRRAA